MINFKTNQSAYLNDLSELVRAFEQYVDGGAFGVELNAEEQDGQLLVEIKSDKFDLFSKKYCFDLNYGTDEMEHKRQVKRNLKIALYGVLAFLTNHNLPYGCLTGIRPTKLFSELGDNAEEVFTRSFSVSPSKLELVKLTVDTQKGIRNNTADVDFFVNIPFCPTRCAYCSFISVPITKQKKLLESYCEKLILEISILKKVIFDNNLHVRAVYVGGGTPTSLPVADLDRILSQLDIGDCEFTVEAGRPDTITPEVLKVLRKRKVTRISINPQTFNQATLDKIGRAHTVQDIFDAYKRAKWHGLFSINMDLIAMLPGESFEDFKNSVDTAVALSPDNVTVHTLSLKRGSNLTESGYDNTDFALAEKMVNYAFDRLKNSGYAPYYMYRQKYTSGNLENVGYTKSGKQCLYNVDIMEEDTTILACGAGAISKKVDTEKNLITRQANLKEPKEYIERFEDIVSRTLDFWKQ